MAYPQDDAPYADKYRPKWVRNLDSDERVSNTPYKQDKLAGDVVQGPWTPKDPLDKIIEISRSLSKPIQAPAIKDNVVQFPKK